LCASILPAAAEFGAIHVIPFFVILSEAKELVGASEACAVARRAHATWIASAGSFASLRMTG
jgi:hypothetical protein